MHDANSSLSSISATDRVAWPVMEWAKSVGIGKTTAYLLLQRGDIPSIKVGVKRLITISPAAYVETRANGVA